MLHVLENERLCVKVSDDGAELVGVFDKVKGREMIWQADPAYWKRHAPVLFPNVGRHFGDCYRVEGRVYPSKQHGFARDSVFVCVKKGAGSVTHELCSSKETKEIYPFDFALRITHTLKEDQIFVSWEVANTGKDSMYFTIGGHPAFRVPVIEDTAYSDYSLFFEGMDSLKYLLLDPASGTAVTEAVYTLGLSNSACSLDTHMFDNDALVFDGGQIKKAGILLPDGTPYLELSCEGFPNFGIWSVPGAPFVCLEPWMGRTDDRGYEGELRDKPNINALASGDIFQASYSIRVF